MFMIADAYELVTRRSSSESVETQEGGKAKEPSPIATASPVKRLWVSELYPKSLLSLEKSNGPHVDSAPEFPQGTVSMNRHHGC